MTGLDEIVWNALSGQVPPQRPERWIDTGAGNGATIYEAPRPWLQCVGTGRHIRPLPRSVALLRSKRSDRFIPVAPAVYARHGVVVDLDVGSVLGLLADAVRKQRCILFLGAGVHAPPPAGSPFEYPPSRRPPVGSALSRELARTCGLAERFPSEDPANLQRVALFYEIARSRHQLVDAVRTAVQAGRQPSPMLRALAELHFPLVITTNYDQLFEQALAATGKQPRVAVYTPNLEPTVDYRDPTAESPIVFKIHGDIARPETIVITDEDYIQFVLRMSNKDPYDPVPLTLKYYLTGWTTLFVGYSLLDYNLRLLFKTLRWKIDSANVPDMYSVDYHPDPLIFDVWHNQRRYVKFIAQDAWAFVPRLYELALGKELRP